MKAPRKPAAKPVKGGRDDGNMRSGARIIVDALEELGVSIVFGYPGGSIIKLYDEISRSHMKVILSGDERCAGHAAEGYARATGKVGVMLCTSGPGATNLVTPLADARMDSTAVVAISGQVASGVIGRDAFQEAPMQAATFAITKHNYLVTRAADLGRVVREAFHIAGTGRPGPVLVDVAKDAQAAMVDIRATSNAFQLRGYNPVRKLNLNQIDRAMDLLATAKRPLLYVGQGVVLANAWKELRKFVEITGIPVTETLLAKGAFPASHKLWVGTLGMHGAAYANYAIHEADVVVVLGARFDDRVTGNPAAFATQAKWIQVDIDPSEINKNVTVQVPVAADVKEALAEMVKRAKPAACGEWVKRIDELKRKFPYHYKPGTGEIKPQYFLERLMEAMQGKGIVTTGVGQHQMWALQYCRFDEPRRFITSGGAGTMGFGLPAAVGAQFGRPGELVVDVDGDGSFEMNINELRTVRDNNLPIKIAIMNNRMLGMVGQWQRKFFKGNYSSTEFTEDIPNFVAGVHALYGVPGRKIAKRAEVVPAIDEMLKSRGAFLLDVTIPKDEDVYPMIPAGATIKDIMLGEAQGHTPPV